MKATAAHLQRFLGHLLSVALSTARRVGSIKLSTLLTLYWGYHVRCWDIRNPALNFRTRACTDGLPSGFRLSAWNIGPRLRQEGEPTFGAPPNWHGSPHSELRSRQDEQGISSIPRNL